MSPDNYLGYFTLNYVLELAVVRLCLPSFKLMRLAAVVFAMNMATHPVLWFLLSQAFDDYWPKLLVGEAFVFVIEALLGLLLLGRTVVPKTRIIWAISAGNLFSFAFTFIA